jgi:hypothetical protein
MARSGEVLVLHDQRVRLGDGSAAVEFSGPPEDLVGPPADGVAGAPGSVAAPPPGVLPRGAP